VTKTPTDGSTFSIGESIKVKALHTPCHTQDSISYFFEDGNERAVFTGDTLFIGGCGRFFEGTPEEMHKALNKTLASLPDDTKVYVGLVACEMFSLELTDIAAWPRVHEGQRQIRVER
jgi:hydroxyacylglutathione hydrolase